MNSISQDPESRAARHAAKLLRTQSARTDTVRRELATITARMKAHAEEAKRLDAVAPA